MFAKVLAALLLLAVGQDAGGVLRIRVALADSTGAPTPIPRVVLLVSDNPATSEPKRIRTTADGTVELRLRPGSYTIESDEPIAFGGSAYTWTQIITVSPGRDTVLELNAKNAEVGPVTAGTASASGRSDVVEADSAVLLSRWRDSVVEIWTPTVHASGTVIDGRGLIATSYRAIGTATEVAVEMTSG